MFSSPCGGGKGKDFETRAQKKIQWTNEGVNQWIKPFILWPMTLSHSYMGVSWYIQERKYIPQLSKVAFLWGIPGSTRHVPGRNITTIDIIGTSLLIGMVGELERSELKWLNLKNMNDRLNWIELNWIEWLSEWTSEAMDEWIEMKWYDMKWNEMKWMNESMNEICRPHLPKALWDPQFFSNFMWNQALATVLCTFCRPLLQIEARTRGNRDPALATTEATLPPKKQRVSRPKGFQVGVHAFPTCWCCWHDGENAGHENRP